MKLTTRLIVWCAHSFGLWCALLNLLGFDMQLFRSCYRHLDLCVANTFVHYMLFTQF